MGMREIKFRAYINSPATDLKPSIPYGTGSSWFSRWQMGVVQMLNISKNSCRVSAKERDYHEDGSYTEGKKSFDLPIGKNCIIMQFTGLQDKNGVDICKVTYCNHSTPNSVLVQRVGFDFGTFSLIKNNTESELEEDRTNVPLYYSFAPNTIEIIGNIHENPELLK